MRHSNLDLSIWKEYLFQPFGPINLAVFYFSFSGLKNDADIRSSYDPSGHILKILSDFAEGRRNLLRRGATQRYRLSNKFYVLRINQRPGIHVQQEGANKHLSWPPCKHGTQRFRSLLCVLVVMGVRLLLQILLLPSRSF